MPYSGQSSPATPNSASSQVRFFDKWNEVRILEDHYAMRARHEKDHHRTSAFVEYSITPMNFVQRWKHRKYMREVRRRNLVLQKQMNKDIGCAE